MDDGRVGKLPQVEREAPGSVVTGVHAFAPKGKAGVAEKQSGAVVREAVVSGMSGGSAVVFDAMRGLAALALQKSVIGVHVGGVCGLLAFEIVCALCVRISTAGQQRSRIACGVQARRAVI